MFRVIFKLESENSLNIYIECEEAFCQNNKIYDRIADFQFTNIYRNYFCKSLDLIVPTNIL